MADSEGVPAITLLARPAVRLSDYLKHKILFPPGREIFIVPDKFWDRLPELIKEKHG